jgi:hypothetical protein
VTKRPASGFLIFLGFLLIASAYFYRIFTEGALPVFGDGLDWIYPMRLYAARAGLAPPLWNPHMFAGMPFVGLMQTAALYPPNLMLYSLLPAEYAFNASFLLHYALAGYFTFILLREMGLSRTAAFFGACFFSFSGFLISTKQHIAILNAAAWMPLIVFLAERLRKSPGVRYALALSLAVAIQVLAGNFQVCVYTYIVLAVYLAFSVFEVQSGRRIRFAALLAAGGALGLLLAFPQIYATWQMSGVSLRPVVGETLGYLFSREYHVYLSTLPSAVFPHLYSSGVIGAALPGPEDRMIVFTGVLPLALSALAVTRRWKLPAVRFWAAVGVLGLVLAAADDTPLGRLLFHVPVYGMFHANGRNMLELSLAVAALSAFGMDYVLTDKGRAMAALKALGAVLSASAIALVITYYTRGEEARTAITVANPAVYMPVIFVALYALCLALYRVRGAGVIVLFLFAVFIAEAYSFGAYHQAGWSSASALAGKCEEGGYSFLKAQAGDEPFRAVRVDTMKRQLYHVPCGVDLFNSQDPLIPADYAYLFDLEPFGYSRYWDNLLRGNTLLSMMNVKYLLVPSTSDLGLEGIRTASGGVRPGAAAGAWKGPFDLPDPSDRSRSTINFDVPLERGTYIVTLRATPVDAEGATLRLEVYNAGQESLRAKHLPFNVYPGIMGAGQGKYYRLFQSQGPQLARIGISSPKRGPITIESVAVRRLEGFGPQPVMAAGKVYQKVRELNGYEVYLNRNALPRAGDIREIREIYELNLVNPAKQAVLLNSDMAAVGVTSFTQADVSITNYAGERVVLRTDSPGRSFVVLADQYYPGWRALIDGKPSRIYKTNGVMRGVVVPAGEHEVVFEYRAPWLMPSALASLAVALASILYIIKVRGKGEG